jgi:hypothetical protein
MTDDRAEVLATITAGLATIDGAATWLWIDYGLAAEGNPLVNWLIGLYGHEVGLTVRTLLVVAGLSVLARLGGRLVVNGLSVALLVYGGVVGWHLWGAVGGAW